MILSKLTNLFKMEPKPIHMDTIKEEMLEANSPTTEEDTLSTIDGKELVLSGDLTEEEVDEVKDSVGGPEEYSKMITWAAYFLPQDEEDTYDWIVKAGQPQYIKLAVAQLYAKFKADCAENDGLEERMDYCSRINAVTNRYSDEAIYAFKMLDDLDLNMKDYLQIARVLASKAATEADEHLEKELKKTKPNKIGLRYLSTMATLLDKAKTDLWDCKLPHEIETSDDD